MAGLKRRLDLIGAKFLWSTEVTGLAGAPRLTSVQTSHGKFDADEIVLAGGSWSPFVARQLGLKLPMQAGKGYSLTLTNPRQLPQLCSIFTEARLAVTPMEKWS